MLKKILIVLGRSAGLMFLANLIIQLPFFGSGPGSLRAHDFNDAGFLSGTGPREVRLCQADGSGNGNDEIEEIESDCEADSEDIENDSDDSDCEISDCEDSDCEDSDCEDADCD